MTVEAASPALIEKVRTTVSDGTGQYRILDLVPGTYNADLHAPGFHHGRSRGRRGQWRSRHHHQRGHARRRRSGDDYRHRGDSGRRRADAAPDERRCIDKRSSQRFRLLADTATSSPRCPGSSRRASTPVPTRCMNFFTATGGRGNEGTVQIDGMNVGSAFNGGGVAGFAYDTSNAAGNPGQSDRRTGRDRSRRTGLQHDSREPVETSFSGTYFLSYAGEWAQCEQPRRRAADVRHQRSAWTCQELGHQLLVRRPDK